VEIEILTPKTYEHYERFLLAFECSLLYHSTKYKELLETLLGCESYYLMAVDKDDIKGVLPLMKAEGLYGTVYNSLPFYGSHGGVLSHDGEIHRALVREYNTLVSKDNVAGGTLIGNPFFPTDYETITHNVTDSRIGQWTPIGYEDNPEEELMQSFHSKTRNMVRKAIKSNVTAEIDNAQLEFLKDLHKQNMASIGGKAKSDRFFTLIEKFFEPGKDYNVIVASINGEPVAALLLFYYNKTVEYYTPAVDVAFRTFQPLSLIIFRAMIESARCGYKYWNWGGTWLTQDGVFRFKKRWGTQNTPYTYYVHINNENVFYSTQEELLKEYGNFYVIPFSELKGER